MHIGLVTPPGLLGAFVARAIEPAGHTLSVATSLEALAEQTETPCDVVIFAPVVGDRDAVDVLDSARGEGTAPGHAIYLGLDAKACEVARARGFERAFAIPFQAHELVSSLERSARGKLRILLVDDSPLIHKHTVPI